jgi:putative endonuclease
MKLSKTNYQIGIDAENTAALYLQKMNYKILQRRWKSKSGEIDLISIKDNQLIFIEVKARKNHLYDQVIFSKQQKRNSNAALDFLSRSNISINHPNLEIRYDCIIINNNKVISYIENAWYIEDHSLNNL